VRNASFFNGSLRAKPPRQRGPSISRDPGKSQGHSELNFFPILYKKSQKLNKQQKLNETNFFNVYMR